MWPFKGSSSKLVIDTVDYEAMLKEIPEKILRVLFIDYINRYSGWYGFKGFTKHFSEDPYFKKYIRR